jgi:hypothetical protein
MILAPSATRPIDGTRDRIDLKARADRDEQVRFRCAAERALDHLGYERLAERNGRALEDAAAVAAGRILFAGARRGRAPSASAPSFPHAMHTTLRTVP